MAVEVGAEGWVNDKIIRLTSYETRPVLMNKQVCKKAKQGLNLIGKFVGSNKIDVHAMKEHFQRLWCPMDSNEDLEVIVMEKEEDSNMFLFKFPNREVIEKVVAYSSGGPWSFDDQLLLLADLDITSSSTSSKNIISFNNLNVWIQIKGLPLHLLHEDVGTLIGASIAEQVHRVEVHIEDRCIRVRTRIKTYKPLRRCARVQTEEEGGDNNLWVDFVYEGIPKVCRWCGRVDHESSGCAVQTGPPGYDGERLLLQKEEIMNPEGGKKQANKEGRRQAVVGIKIKYFTEDIIIEIMRRLPVKSLNRFMCVCKTWYGLISSPEIVVRHNKKVSLFFHRCSSGNKSSSSTNLLFRFSGLPMNLTVPLGIKEVKTKGWEGPEEKIIGCCDGVVCLSLSHVLALWNPTTTQFRIIGEHCFDFTWEHLTVTLEHLSNCGFCFDPVSNSFKVVFVPFPVKGASELKVKILTTTTARTNNYSWREANTLLPCRISMVSFMSGICVGRYMYWKVMSTEHVYYILCFDMVNEAFNRIDVPPTAYNLMEFRLSCYEDDNIAFILRSYGECKYHSVVYTLNDCRQSWTRVRKMVKPYRGESSKRGFFSMDGVDWIVFRESYNGRVLMIDKETNQTSKLFPWKGSTLDDVYQFYQYKESLVSF